MFVGVMLLLMGGLMLLDRLGMLPGDAWDYFMPIAIIALGFSFIAGHRKHKQIH